MGELVAAPTVCSGRYWSLPAFFMATGWLLCVYDIESKLAFESPLLFRPNFFDLTFLLTWIDKDFVRSSYLFGLFLRHIIATDRFLSARIFHIVIDRTGMIL